jgi:hypothetical protein
VVRDLNVFEKQRQRIEKFDKMILGYVARKERDVIFDNPHYQHEKH